MQLHEPVQCTAAAVAAVAVTGESAASLDEKRMPTRLFTCVGERHGAAFALDGGGDGKPEDTSERRSSARRASGGEISASGGKPTVNGGMATTLARAEEAMRV